MILRYFKLFLMVYPLYILMDVTCLKFILSNFYTTQLKQIARMVDGQMRPKVIPALLAWGLLVIGILAVIVPHCSFLTAMQAFIWGALYGLVVYGIYDLSNFSILSGWSAQLAFVDVAWGMTLNGIGALLVFFLSRY